MSDTRTSRIVPAATAEGIRTGDSVAVPGYGRFTYLGLDEATGEPVIERDGQQYLLPQPELVMVLAPVE